MEEENMVFHANVHLLFPSKALQPSTPLLCAPEMRDRSNGGGLGKTRAHSAVHLTATCICTLCHTLNEKKVRTSSSSILILAYSTATASTVVPGNNGFSPTMQQQLQKHAIRNKQEGPVARSTSVNISTTLEGGVVLRAVETETCKYH